MHKNTTTKENRYGSKSFYHGYVTQKGAHLTFEERVIIQTRLRDKQSYRSIAREIGCCVNTVRNEVKRGKVLCYNGKVERYRAADGQSTYEAHRENCGRKCDAIAKGAFLDYVQKKLQEHHWSLDACFGRALVTGEFQRDEMVCTKTLYNYVTLGLLGKIKSIDLPLRVKRKTPGSGFVSVRRSSVAA